MPRKNSMTKNIEQPSRPILKKDVINSAVALGFKRNEMDDLTVPEIKKLIFSRIKATLLISPKKTTNKN